MGPPVPVEEQPQAKPARAEKPKVKMDPQLIAKARELRDRYLEHVNSDPHALRAVGKYAVCRTLSAVEGSRLPDQSRDTKPPALLPAA